MRHAGRNHCRDTFVGIDTFLWILLTGIAAIAIVAGPLNTPIARSAQVSAPTDAKPNPVAQADKDKKTSKPTGKPAVVYREWHDVTGRHSVEAELVEFTGDRVVLRKRNNRTALVPIEKLCMVDRKYVYTLALGGNLIVGPVLKVIDGDTLVVQGVKKKHAVSLRGIEAPKKMQPFASRAKDSLSKKILKKKVRVNWNKRDKSFRIIGDVYLGDRWINREMLEEGCARHSKRYPASKELVNAEKQAQSAKAGLWTAPVAIAARNPGGSTTGKAGSPANRPAVDPQKGSSTVYVTKSGKKYHRSGCPHLSKSKTPIPLSEAQKKYSPCKQCKPPS